MGCRCAPACKFGLDSATKRWPKRNRASDGCCGDAAHQKRGSRSDHNPDASGYAHAFDLTHDVKNGPDCKEWSRLVIKDPRVTYVIFAGEIWKARTGKWEKYTGPNKHNQHMHVSIKSTATFDVSPWPWSPIPVVVRPVLPTEQENTKVAVTYPVIENPRDEDKGVTIGTQPEGETSGSPPPAPAVEIRASESSWKTKIGSLSIPGGIGVIITGAASFVKGLPPYAWFAFAAILIAGMVIGYLVWKTDKDQAHSRTEKLMDAGASQEKNNLRLV